MSSRTLAATLAAAALLAAGCSSTSTEKTTTSGATPSQAVRFSECMREHGVREFPDPDASGELTIDGILNGSSLDPEAPVWKSALEACRDLQPAGFTGRPRSTTEQDAALAFARCMRKNGVADFPDPAEGEPLVNTNRIPSSNRPGGMDVLNAAMRTCGDEAQRAMGEQ